MTEGRTAAGDIAANLVLLSRGYRTRLLAILLFANFLNYLDRAVVGAALEPMRRELGLSDTQLGLLQGVAFGLVYALLSLPIGRLADVSSRKVMLVCSTVTFTAMSGLCALVSGFVPLFLLRAGVGAGEAAFMPPTSSLLADHYPPERRASAFSIVGLGPPLGYLAGGIAGGLIVGAWGWRAVFLASVIPGAVAAALIALFVKEPPRGLIDRDRAPPASTRSLAAVLRHLLSYKSFRHLIAGASIALFCTYSGAQFTFPFLQRVHHLTPGQSGMAAGLIALVSVGAGTLLGGYGVDWARRYDVRWTTRIPAIGTLLSAAILFGAFLTPSPMLAVAGMVLGTMMLALIHAPTYSTVQNLSAPGMRATAVGFTALVFGVLGAGLGPTITGMVSDKLTRAHFAGDYGALCTGSGGRATMYAACEQAAAYGLRWALAIIALGAVWSAFHFWMAGRTLQSDLRRAGA